MAQQDLELVGAVQEHHSISAENPEELELWFPIERIKEAKKSFDW